MRNVRLKLFSLALALLFWYIVTTDIGIATLTVPIEIKNPPESKILLSSFSQQAQVKISGPAFLVSEIVSSPPVFKIELPPDEKDLYVIPLRGDELSFPSAIKVIAVEPSQLEIRFDDRVSKMVTVEVPMIGRLSDDFRIADFSVVPKRVEITGPASEVRSISQVETYPIDLRTITGDSDRKLKLRKPAVRSTVDIEVVEVGMDVEPVEIAKRFDDMPVEIRSLDGEVVSVEPKEVMVEVLGSKSFVRGIMQEGIIPYVRVHRDLKTGSLVEVAVDLPAGLSLGAVRPEKVKIVRSPKLR
jgi:YbbR domain-containing protein